MGVFIAVIITMGVSITVSLYNGVYITAYYVYGGVIFAVVSSFIYLYVTR